MGESAWHKILATKRGETVSEKGVVPKSNAAEKSRRKRTRGKNGSVT